VVITSVERIGTMGLLNKLKALCIASTCFSSVAFGGALSRGQGSVIERSDGQEAHPPSAANAQFAASMGVDNNKASTDLDLLIEIESGKQFEIDGERKIIFADMCNQVGNFFIKNQGLWGTGPFQKFNCAISKSSERSAFQWRLKISEKNGFSRFKLYYFDPSTGKESLQSAYRINATIGPLKILSNERYAQLIAAYLILKLPFNAAIPATDLAESGTISLQGVPESGLTFQRGDLRLFKLARENKIWKSLMLGRAKLIESDANEPKWLIKLESEISQSSGSDVSKNFVLIRFTSEKKEILKQIDEILRQEVSRDVNKLLASIRSAYIGTRYGVPIGGGEGVLGVTPMVGVLGEFRSGFLEGLRIYFDSRPKKQLRLNNYSEEFSLSRVQVGYGIGKVINSAIINWIDMMPKIGVTSINLAVAVNDDLDAQKYEFRLHNAPVIGLEMGAERRSETVTARLWLYGNFSLGVRQIEKESKSTSYRLGLDLYKDVFSFRLYKTSILFFTAFENTNFKNKSSSRKITQGSSIQELNYNSLFLGGGLALSW